MIEFGIRNAIPFAFNHSIGSFPFVVAKHDQIGSIARRPVRNGHLDAYAVRFVPVPVDEFGPKFSSYLFLWVRISLRVIHGDVSNLLGATLA